MSGQNVDRAIALGVDMLEPVRRAYQHFDGQPKSFWEGPFVIGYIQSYAKIAADTAFKLNATPTQRGDVFFGILSELLGVSSVRASMLMRAAQSHPDCVDAMGKARLIFAVGTGMADERDHEVIRKAMEVAEKSGVPGIDAEGKGPAAAAILWRELFLSKLETARARYGVAAQ